MKPLLLYPRLNYKYSYKDALYSFAGIFKKNTSDAMLRSLFNRNEIIYFNHARTALTVLLRALNLKKDTGVAMMGFNCLTVMNSITSAEMKPIFVDIDDSFQIDINDLKKKRDRFEVVVVNHMFGIPNNAIYEIKRLFPDLIIIEDCTHAFGTLVNSDLAGTIGDFSIFSYGMAKFPSAMDGGFLIINNAEYTLAIHNETAKLSEMSIFSEIKNIVKGIIVGQLFCPFIYALSKNKFISNLDKKHDVVGKYHQYESKYYKSNQYLFLRRMTIIDTLLQKQMENGKQIRASIPKEIRIFDGDYNFFMLPIVVKDRVSLIAYFADNGIEIGTHFSKSILWAQDFGYQTGDCKKAEFMAENIATIPTHYNMKEKQVKRIQNILAKFSKNNF